MTTTPTSPATPTSPDGVHHLAVMTNDMKGQLEFFTQVLGLPLVALYDMHGVDGAWHGFVELNPTTYLAFCMVPGVEDVEPTLGVTHAGTGAGVSAPGTMQHVAFAVSTEEGLLAIRDRLRSAGVVALGPLDHGMCKSLYFAGPEGLTLEVAWSPAAIDGDDWIDPEVCAAAGISAADVARFRDPAPFVPGDEPVAQPSLDTGMPLMAYPPDEMALMASLPDDVVARVASVPDSPRVLRARAAAGGEG